MAMLSIIGDALKKELTAIEASDRRQVTRYDPHRLKNKAFKKHLPTLLKLVESEFCKEAWRIAANKNFITHDEQEIGGQVYLAQTILSALAAGERDFTETRKQLEELKELVLLQAIDSDMFNEVVRKIEVELPPLTRQSGNEWPRKIFIYRTSLALYKLDGERHDREVVDLANATGKFDTITDKKTITNILDRINLEKIADDQTAVATLTIATSPDPQS
jgi:hypothetical protein